MALRFYMGICKLCLLEKKIINAHIIPNFVYKGIKEKNYVFYNKDSETGKNWTQPKETGEFDSNILCGDCDNGIIEHKYEKYGKTVLFDDYTDTQNIGNFTICRNIDYPKLKLFLLSILWRASISSRPMFSGVNLGKKREERLRRVIYHSIVPKESEYAIMMFIDTSPDSQKFIDKPRYFPNVWGLNGYIFIFDSVQYIFFLNSTEFNIPIPFRQIMLKECGEFTYLHMKDGDLFKNFISRNQKTNL